MEFNSLNLSTKQSQAISINDGVFNRDFNEPLVHQVVVAYLANSRMATRAQKTRSEVSFSTKKPWRQKGTGRARAGMASSPLWRGGGRTFPNRADENFSHKVNKKMYKACISALLSKFAKSGDLIVVDALSLPTPKTKEAVKVFADLKVDNALVITSDFEENLYLAIRNLKDFALLQVEYLNPVSLLKYSKVILTKAALEKIEGALA
ncbi:MAG: 50S ribosomal protein L4 [Pseudomonadota bacterium]